MVTGLINEEEILQILKRLTELGTTVFEKVDQAARKLYEPDPGFDLLTAVTNLLTQYFPQKKPTEGLEIAPEVHNQDTNWKKLVQYLPKPIT